MTAQGLRKRLELCEWSQSELATELGVNSRTVRRWVSGETPISSMARLAIIHVLWSDEIFNEAEEE